jgi:hypothetical protein
VVCRSSWRDRHRERKKHLKLASFSNHATHFDAAPDGLPDAGTRTFTVRPFITKDLLGSFGKLAVLASYSIRLSVVRSPPVAGSGNGHSFGGGEGKVLCAAARFAD